MLMRIIYLMLVLLVQISFVSAQNIGIGTDTPNVSAKLDITSTNSGFLPPRMTYAQRNSILNPAAGLIIYCTDCANGEMQYYNGTTWMQINISLGSVPFVAPTITTSNINSITSTSAVSGGNISSDGGSAVTARGVCWDISLNPTTALSTKTIDGTGIGIYTSNIIGLLPNTSYHVRAYATNAIGTSYGADSSFLTPQAVADLPSVTICSQIWMSKNLEVSNYRNGDPIPYISNASQWASLTTGAWCWYNNDSATYAATYGKLYNWFAVNDARGLAPQGWHIPTDEEWTTLSTCLGGESVAGNKMKEAGTLHWESPNTGADNSSGFTALPGGFRNYNGAVGNNIFKLAYFWSKTERAAGDAWCRVLSYNFNYLNRISSNNETPGFSVRCVRD